MSDGSVCRCGHNRDVHQHLHNRTYCGPCGPARCPAYRRPSHGLADVAATRLNRLLAIIRRRR